MWIGPYGEPSKFKPPASGLSATRSGWSASGIYVTGGAWAVNSTDSHLRYSFTWPFLRSHEVAELEELVYEGELLTVLVGTAYQVNAIPERMTNLSYLGEGEHNLSVVPVGQKWQFSWAGDDQLIIPEHGLVGPGLYEGTGTGDWFTVTRPAPPEELEDTHLEYNGDMVLTFGDIVRTSHKKTRGRGNTGMRLSGEGFRVTEYSAPSALDYHSVTIDLIETGAWE